MRTRRVGLALACATAIGAAPAAGYEPGSLCARDCRPVVQPMPADRRGAQCYYVSATFDGGAKAVAVERSRAALQEVIAHWRAGQTPDSGWRTGRVRMQAAPARPNPYLRGAIPPALLLKPDVRTRDAHTVCWRGVMSPAVCTSAATLCK